MQPGNVATMSANLIEDGNGVGGRTEIPYSLDMISNMNMRRTLYIQMEFVKRQMLREVCIHCDFYFILISYEMCRVDEGITGDKAWKLFGQIVDALVHMSTLGILHHDIKLTNIFIGMFIQILL